MKSTSAAREHILAFGIYGGGKTHAWATIAQMYREMATPGRFYVVGTEWGALARLSDGYADFGDNVEWQDVEDWYDLTSLTSEYLERAEAGDWIVIEGVDKPWQWVMELWDRLHGTPPKVMPNDPFSAAQDGSSTERDWIKINKVYRSWINPILRSPAHVFACCPQEQVRMPDPRKDKGGWHDSKEVIDQYSRFGYRPAGQKELGHHFHSVLWMQNPRKDVWTMTTVDDHTREHQHDTQVTNFVHDYLVKVGKWEL